MILLNSAKLLYKSLSLGLRDLVEIGPEKVLSGLAKISKLDFNILSISNISEIE